MDTDYEIGIIGSGTRFDCVCRISLPRFVVGDCLISFIPSLGNTASSLFRPRRDILAVFDGVFYWSSRAFLVAATIKIIAGT
jgi:hypothetical protein